jgi:hypothetical protein
VTSVASLSAKAMELPLFRRNYLKLGKLFSFSGTPVHRKTHKNSNLQDQED